jgi:nucleoside-diphosphate-sugar epimerase
MNQQHRRTALVTGAAGFIGSRLSEMLLDDGWTVTGVDCFTDYYPRRQKEANVAGLLAGDGFTFVEDDLATMDLLDRLEGVDTVFHQSAQAGVRDSWAGGFASYVQHNVLATQRLLEACLQAGTRRLVYASSSSVYGNAERYPTREQDVTRPFSPYGVTKLAAENLVCAYARNFGLSTVALRYHTVYGPRQRPDMAIHRLFRAALSGEPFPLFAAGGFVRDFTYVDDICRANVLAAEADLAPGTILNLAGGESVTMVQLIDRIGALVGRPVPVEEFAGQAGDVQRTEADWSAARTLLGWTPVTGLDEGLRAQSEWHASVHAGRDHSGTSPRAEGNAVHHGR